MSRSAGPGQPARFKCSPCRSTLIEDRTRGTRWEVTGRIVASRARHGNAAGRIDTQYVYEYRCLDCGHIGWSRHRDVAAKWKIQNKRAKAA